jgi:hypothetical protein
MDDKIFAKGIYFGKPHPNAPDFIKGKIDIKAEDAIEFIKEHANYKGYVNLDLKESKAGNLYLELNTFVPSDSGPDEEPPADMQDKAEHMDFDETHDINPKELF